MGTLIHAANVSLDGHLEDEPGSRAPSSCSVTNALDAADGTGALRLSARPQRIVVRLHGGEIGIDPAPNDIVLRVWLPRHTTEARRS